MKNKKDTRDTEKFLNAVKEDDPAKVKDLLEKVLKEKCAKKIAEVIKSIKN